METHGTGHSEGATSLYYYWKMNCDCEWLKSPELTRRIEELAGPKATEYLGQLEAHVDQLHEYVKSRSEFEL